ncbi:DUF2294 domain-containing protein [Paenibacillus soyae]|uniref:DUF2294 domain-containing protein n=1 Tax=Paenibacillus soyae TaxID=2969249 RepID=A0A9X2SBL9_9BACL|nr:DUF2294 domain-containing protein [Paenibacillus soyae]MCR2807381.1 DUF2294 domain-containing protein [Paenibacillus soyae]
MNTNEHHVQNEIASHMGKLLRDAFGKGPQSIHVSIGGPFLIIYLRHFLTPTERILLEQGQIFAVKHTRAIVMKSLIPEIKAYLLLLTGMHVSEFYYDWDLQHQSGVIVGRQREEEPFAALSQEGYEGREQLHQEIEAISHRVQKKPDLIESFLINRRTLLVVRSGILIDIGKELIRLGDEAHLKQAVQNLEKKQFRNNSRFNQILKTKVLDVFVDWNFGRDRSVIVFIVSPKA